jgi:hypothetical protein
MPYSSMAQKSSYFHTLLEFEAVASCARVGLVTTFPMFLLGL